MQTEKSTNDRKLVVGNSVHQIFSDTQYVFKVSSTLRKLYRYKYDSVTGEVNEISIFKRVRRSEFQTTGLKSQKRKGHYQSFGNVIYEIYDIYNRLTLTKRGYMLSARCELYNETTPEKLFYVKEKRKEDEHSGEMGVKRKRSSTHLSKN